MVRAAKKTYKITNWTKYNESLVRRGDITFWFSDETIQQWEHPNDRIKVGHPFVYSDTAIETLLAPARIVSTALSPNRRVWAVVDQVDASRRQDSGLYVACKASVADEGVA